MFERTFSGVLGPYFAQLKQIGGGGSGCVYSGVETRSGFPVSIKRVSVTNKDDCRAALREIRIRRRLRHENVLGLLNVITVEGTDVREIAPANFRETSCIYFIQELLDADLRQVIESNNRLNDDYVKLFFYQLLRGLKYIHSANVLHRDLKPSNVLVNVNSLELVIGDFGNSIVMDPDYAHSSSQIACDTSLWYKAPELIVDPSKYSTASDMWAVGCILAEMLLGRPLFEGENDMEQLELIIHTIEVNEKDQANVRQCLTREVNKMYTGQPKFPLRSKFQKTDIHALHLLEHLLAFNPGDRVSTELALSHPFLHEYSCAADEPACLKPLHLEHEVDDFLEYTLKDLIVGECVSLAEEKPRIHMQMSSCSSLMDIVKELNQSPNGSISHPVENGKSGIAIKVSTDQDLGESNDSQGDGSRFKVLEVLKEEHTSSSDSNGLTSHEEGVSEEPLVSDHAAMLCSQRWENERHKIGHRRHHSHHRRKSAGDESSRLRKRNKMHKGHSIERETISDTYLQGQVAGGESQERHTSGSRSPDRCCSSDLSLPSDKLCTRSSDPNLTSEMGDCERLQDDQVKELINKSNQLIADHMPRDPPETGNHGNSVNPRELNGVSCRTRESDVNRTAGGLPEDGLYTASDATAAEVIRRSRELLGETVDDHVPISTVEHCKNIGELNSAQDVVNHTLQPMVSDLSNLRESDRRMQELLEESHTLLCNLRGAEPTEPLAGNRREPGSVESLEVELTVNGPATTDMSSVSSRGNVFQSSENFPRNDIDLDEMRAVLDKAKQLLAQSEEASGDPRPTASDYLVGLEKRANHVEANAGSVDDNLCNGKDVTCASTRLNNAESFFDLPRERTANSDGKDTTSRGPDEANSEKKPDGNVEDGTETNVGEQPKCRQVTLVTHDNQACKLFCPPEHPYAFQQQVLVFETAAVEYSAEYEQHVLVMTIKTRAQKSSVGNHSDHTNPAGEPGPEKDIGSTENPFAHNDNLLHAEADNQIKTEQRMPADQQANIYGTDEYLEKKSAAEQSQENVVISYYALSTNDCSENASKPTPKNLDDTKTKTDNNGAEEITEDTSSLFESRHCHGNSIGAEPAEKTTGGTMEKQLRNLKEREHPTNQTSNTTRYSITETRSTNKLYSQDIVDKFCRTNGRTSEKNGRATHAVLLSNDDAGLKNFYATIKIKSLMNRSRTYRDKLHEPYPF